MSEEEKKPKEEKPKTQEQAKKGTGEEKPVGTPQEKTTGEVKLTAKVKSALKAVMDLSVDERKAFITEYVGQLSVLELNDQVKILEEKFDVSAAPTGMMMAAVPGAPAAGQAEAEVEKTSFDVVLKEIGPKKIQVIKAVRAVTSLGLKEAKALVDGAPGTVKEGVSKEDAEKIMKELEGAGAVVEMK